MPSENEPKENLKGSTIRKENLVKVVVVCGFSSGFQKGDLSPVPRGKDPDPYNARPRLTTSRLIESKTSRCTWLGD